MGPVSMNNKLLKKHKSTWFIFLVVSALVFLYGKTAYAENLTYQEHNISMESGGLDFGGACEGIGINMSFTFSYLLKVDHIDGNFSINTVDVEISGELVDRDIFFPAVILAVKTEKGVHEIPLRNSWYYQYKSKGNNPLSYELPKTTVNQNHEKTPITVRLEGIENISLKFIPLVLSEGVFCPGFVQEHNIAIERPPFKNTFEGYRFRKR